MTTNTLTTSSVSASPVSQVATQQVLYPRLAWVGLLAIVLASIANLVVRAVALQLISVSPEFIPLAIPDPTVVFTAVGVLAATTAFGIIGNLTRQPARVFTVVATIALLISLIPNAAILLNPASAPFPSSNTESVVVLMLEHVVAAVVVVWMLTTQAVETLPTKEVIERSDRLPSVTCREF